MLRDKKERRRGGKTRRSGKGRKLRNTRKNRHYQKGGNTEVCGPVGSASAACNAGSGSNYVITLFGDAYTQLKKAISDMF